MASEVSVPHVGVSISTLWPATAIKSHVTDVANVPDSHMRTPHIFADAVLGIANEPSDKYVKFFFFFFFFFFQNLSRKAS